jgi:hypothetical protein
MKLLQMCITNELVYNFTESEEIYVGWKELPYSPRLNNILQDYEDIRRELKALQILFERELERLESDKKESF